MQKYDAAAAEAKFAELRKVGGEMMNSMIRAGHKNETRDDTAKEVIRRLNESELPANDRRFIGGYIMAQYGYGGGL